MTDFNVGDKVVTNRIVRYLYGIGGGYVDSLEEGTVGYITRVYTQSVTFRTVRTHRPYGDEPDEISFNISKDALSLLNPNDPRAKEPRQLGTPPEDVVDPLMPDDPRLSWFWDDAGQLAKQMNHCSVYDQMCDRLGVPGRMRTISVSLEVNGLTVSTKVEARSKKEAEALVREKMKAANV